MDDKKRCASAFAAAFGVRHKRGFADTKERGREGEETSFHFSYSSFGDREEKRMSFFPFPLFPGHIS